MHCCRGHLSQALSNIDSPLSNIRGLCVTLSNIFFKAFVLGKSDRENQLGCLRRKEKLTTKS